MVDAWMGDEQAYRWLRSEGLDWLRAIGVSCKPLRNWCLWPMEPVDRSELAAVLREV